MVQLRPHLGRPREACAASPPAPLRRGLSRCGSSRPCRAAPRRGVASAGSGRRPAKPAGAARESSPRLTADFTEEKTTHLLNKPLTSKGTIAFQSPNKFRRELKGSSPSLTVSNGEKLWIYYPNFKEAELYTLGQRQFFDDSIAALTAGLNFDARRDLLSLPGLPRGNGYRMILTPKTSGLKRMVKELAVTIDEDFKIVKTEATLPKADKVVTTYRNQRATAVPAATFEFTPPSGARVSQPLGK